MQKETSLKDGEGKIENITDRCLLYFAPTGDKTERQRRRHATRCVTNMLSLNVCVNKTRQAMINTLLSCFRGNAN